MPQFPIFVDNTTVHGDGTEEHPLSASGSATPPTEIESTDGNISADCGVTTPDHFTVLNSETTGAIVMDNSGTGGTKLTDSGGGGIVLDDTAAPGSVGVKLFSGFTIVLGGVGGATISISGDGTTETPISIGVSGDHLGFFGQPPQPKGTVTGSKGGNAALSSLLNALGQNGYGLIEDESS
jgi:hypothetical protein